MFRGVKPQPAILAEGRGASGRAFGAAEGALGEWWWEPRVQSGAGDAEGTRGPRNPRAPLPKPPRVGRGAPRAGGLCRTRSPTENCDQKLGVRAVVKV